MVKAAAGTNAPVFTNAGYSTTGTVGVHMFGPGGADANGSQQTSDTAVIDFNLGTYCTFDRVETTGVYVHTGVGNIISGNSIIGFRQGVGLYAGASGNQVTGNTLALRWVNATFGAALDVTYVTYVGPGTCSSNQFSDNEITWLSGSNPSPRAAKRGCSTGSSATATPSVRPPASLPQRWAAPPTEPRSCSRRVSPPHSSPTVAPARPASPPSAAS